MTRDVFEGRGDVRGSHNIRTRQGRGVRTGVADVGGLVEAEGS